MASSHLIQSTENLYSLPAALSKLGYNSVFDLVGIARERFVREHRDTLGRNAGAMYDLAMGYAHQVANQFRHKLVAQGMAAHGPFSTSGPDYSSQFLDPKVGWTDRAPTGAPEANDGPVAYLAYLYTLALEQEGNKPSLLTNLLNTRRPDIGALVVDNAAINEEIPQIQLVNEVLASAIQSTQQLSGTDGVNQLLAKTRFPNSLPYHYANQQIRVAESVLNVCLFDCLLPQDIALLQGFWSPQAPLVKPQADDLVRLQIMASGLGPEQQKIISEGPYFGNYHLVMSDLYEEGHNDKSWQAYSIIDSFIYSTQPLGGFTLPIQAAVQEYAGRPQLPIADSNTKGSSTLYVFVSSDPEPYFTEISFKSWHSQYDDNLLLAESEEYKNSTKDVLCISYSPTDNSTLDLSKADCYAQFTMNYWVDSGARGNRDVTVSIHLSNDANARYSAPQKEFYADNFGPGANVSMFASMQALTSRTGLTVPEVEQMLCATAGGTTAFTVVQSPNYILPNTIFADGHSVYPSAAIPFSYGAKFIHAGLGPCVSLGKQTDGSLQITSLTDDRLDRMNRMIRLQKWLGLPFEDIDLLVTSAMQAEGFGNSALMMNDNTLRMLGVFKRYQQLYNVSAKQFAAWLFVVTPFAITPEQPLLDQVFNSTGAFDTPLVLDGHLFDYTNPSGEDGDRMHKICAALGITRRQSMVLAKEVATRQGVETPGMICCDLFNLSSMYRMVSLGRALGLNPDDFYALAQLMDQGTGAVLSQLAGQPVVTTPQNGSPLASDFLSLLLALSDIAQWLQDRNLSVPVLSAMATPPQSGVQGTAYQLAFIQEVWQQLPNTMVTPTLFQRSGAPIVDDAQQPIDWLTLLSATASPLIDATGLVTDVADVTDDLPIGETPNSIITFIEDVVIAVQGLNSDEKSQAMISLTAAVRQARRTQTGIATSLLAKALDVTQSLPTLLLAWAQETPYKWLQSTWALSTIVKTPADIPAAYLNSLGEIARRALVCQQFSLSPAAVQHLLANPDQFGLGSPYGGEVTLSTLYMLGRYGDLLHQVGESKGGTEDAVLAYLQQANGKLPPTAVDAATSLAALLGWDQEEVQASWAVSDGGIAKTVSQLDAVMRLQQTQLDTGLNVSQQQHAFVLDRDSDYSAWQAVGQAMVAGTSYVNSAN